MQFWLIWPISTGITSELGYRPTVLCKEIVIINVFIDVQSVCVMLVMFFSMAVAILPLEAK